MKSMDSLSDGQIKELPARFC